MFDKPTNFTKTAADRKIGKDRIFYLRLCRPGRNFNYTNPADFVIITLYLKIYDKEQEADHVYWLL